MTPFLDPDEAPPIETVVETRQDLLVEPGGTEHRAGLLARPSTDVAGAMTRRPAPVRESVPS